MKVSVLLHVFFCFVLCGVKTGCLKKATVHFDGISVKKKVVHLAVGLGLPRLWGKRNIIIRSTTIFQMQMYFMFFLL